MIVISLLLISKEKRDFSVLKKTSSHPDTKLLPFSNYFFGLFPIYPVHYAFETPKMLYKAITLKIQLMELF